MDPQDALRAFCPGGEHYRPQPLPTARVVSSGDAVAAGTIQPDTVEPNGAVIMPYVAPIDGFVLPMQLGDTWNVVDDVVVANQGQQGKGKRRGRKLGSRNNSSKKKKV